MKHKPVSSSRLRQLLAAYGADPSRFPKDEERAARALLETSEAARSEAREERELDLYFEAAQKPELSPEFEQRLSAVAARERSNVLRFPRRALWVPALGWAAAAALGLWLGAQSTDDGVEEADMTLSADDSSFAALAQGSLGELEDSP